LRNEIPFENRIKRALKSEKKTAGAWLQIASPITAEIRNQAGFDWLLIDMEHGPGDMLTVVSRLQATKGTETAALARAPWNDFVTTKRILDTGVDGLLIPYVNTKEEAESAVQSAGPPHLDLTLRNGSLRVREPVPLGPLLLH
jgi:2-dehydro-3-deoxyglucarate aldolase/4-hydroxy-2-oxoheptanedioate aldolase